MAVAKAKKKNAASNKLKEREDFIESRYKYALEVKDAQDETTVVAINRAVVRLLEIAQAKTGPPADERVKSVQVMTVTWIAVRMFVACAEWEIRLANYKPVKSKCAKCGTKTKGGK